MSMPWIKSKTTQLDDPRLMRCNERTQAHYFKLYLLAGKCDAEGAFVMNDQRLTDQEIAFLIRTDIKHLKASWRELKANKLVHVNGRGPAITDFAHEQVPQAKRQEAWKERQKRHRTVTRDKDVTAGDSTASHAPRIQNRGRVEEEKKKNRKDPPPPTPPQHGDDTALAGKAGTYDPSLADLVGNKTALRRAELAMKILKPSGLRNPKLKNLAVELATRKFKNDSEFTGNILAALASSYADPTAVDKAAVAAYRIEHGEVPASFMDPSTWSVIPRKVFEDAGIKAVVESDKWEIKR